MEADGLHIVRAKLIYETNKVSALISTSEERVEGRLHIASAQLIYESSVARAHISNQTLDNCLLIIDNDHYAATEKNQRRP